MELTYKIIAIATIWVVALSIINFVEARTVYVYVCCAGSKDLGTHHTIKVISSLTGMVHKKTVDLGKLADKQDWDDVYTTFHLKTGDVGFKACIDGGHCRQSTSNNEVHLRR